MTEALPLVTVFGSTGAQGGGVAHALVGSKKFRVRGITRSTTSERAQKLASAGVELAQADLAKRAEILKAFEGAYAAFIVTDFWSVGEKETEYATAAMECAKEAGVKVVIWSTLPDTEKISGGKIVVPHFVSKAKVDAVVERLGFEHHTFLMAGLYFQNFEQFGFTAAGKGEDDGAVVFQLPMPPTGMITAFDVSDMGPAALAVLEDPKKWDGKYVALAGFHGAAREYAEIFAAVKDRKTVYKQVEAANEEFRAMFDWFTEYTYFGTYDISTGRECFSGLKTWSDWLKTSPWNGPPGQ